MSHLRFCSSAGSQSCSSVSLIVCQATCACLSGYWASIIRSIIPGFPESSLFASRRLRTPFYYTAPPQKSGQTQLQKEKQNGSGQFHRPRFLCSNTAAAASSVAEAPRASRVGVVSAGRARAAWLGLGERERSDARP